VADLILVRSVTNEQTDEARKLIAGMRANLALIAGATDTTADKLIAILNERGGDLYDSLVKLLNLLNPEDRHGPEADRLHPAVFSLEAIAQSALIHEDRKATLAASVKKLVPYILGLLQALQKKADA
jgi:hypothetical protein